MSQDIQTLSQMMMIWSLSSPRQRILLWSQSMKLFNTVNVWFVLCLFNDHAQDLVLSTGKLKAQQQGVYKTFKIFSLINRILGISVHYKWTDILINKYIVYKLYFLETWINSLVILIQKICVSIEQFHVISTHIILYTAEFNFAELLLSTTKANIVYYKYTCIVKN